MIAGFNRGYNGFQQNLSELYAGGVGRDPPLHRGRLEDFAGSDRPLRQLEPLRGSGYRHMTPNLDLAR